MVQYLQTASNIWSFVLSAPADTNSYIAIGFSTSGVMVGSSAMVGWVSSNGGGVVKQYYLGGTSPNLVAPDQGNLQVVTNSTTIISQSSRLYLAFQLETNQPQSRLLYSVGPTNFFPSSPNYLLSEHRAKVSTSINYVTGKQSHMIILFLLYANVRQVLLGTKVINHLTVFARNYSIHILIQ